MNNRGSNKNENKSKTYRTSPPRQSFALPRRYSFGMIICITTKSEEFVFG